MKLTAIAVAAYAAAMILANIVVASVAGRAPHLLPIATACNAFFLIGFDLTIRDLLHVRLRRWQMLAVIAGAGLVTWALNPAAAHIAAASTSAFVLAGVADLAVFQVARGTWLRRANVSNVAGAAVDSIAFPLLAGWGLDPAIALPMFAAKVAGGATWAWIMAHVIAPSAART